MCEQQSFIHSSHVRGLHRKVGADSAIAWHTTPVQDPTFAAIGDEVVVR